MKLKLVAVAVTSLLAAGVVNAAEVYNKDGNKLDLYGKVHAQHYFSDDNGSDGDKTYARLGFKGETQINDQLTGFGHGQALRMPPPCWRPYLAIRDELILRPFCVSKRRCNYLCR